MAYIKNTWVDREGVTRYFETVDEDGALILTPDYAQVTEIGTPVNADNMNHIEEGIASGSFTKFDLNATYFENDLVTTIEDGTPVIYKSLINDNTGNSLADSASWEKISLGGGGGGLEIGDIGFSQMAIDESKGKRRILNGSVIIQDQYPIFSEIVKSSVAQNADMACTEEEWQTEITMTGLCGKYVIDDTAGTIRLPKFPEYFIGNVADIASVVGNGMSMGLYNNEIYGGLGSHIGTTAYAVITTNTYGQPIGTANGGTYMVNGKSVGLTPDPTKSGIEAQIEQNKIYGSYFIQVATGASVKENITNEIELNNPFVLLEGEYFTAPVYNASWLQSNEGFTGSSALHPTAYNALLIEQNPNVLVGTTVDNYTKRGLSVKLNTEAYTDYDFVLNTTSQTFRCPLKINKASGGAVVGNGITLGLTDGTNNVGLLPNGSHYENNSANAYGVQVGTSLAQDSYISNKSLGITTDPTKSGIETSDEGLYLYFYVGETVQNANLVNVGRVEEKVASLIPDNSSMIVDYLTPDMTTKVALTSNAGFTSDKTQWLQVGFYTANTTVHVYVNGIVIFNQYSSGTNSTTGYWYLLHKGDVVTVNRSVNSSSATIKLYTYQCRGTL